ncbi:hypothetical protein EDB84DRAFT_1544721, partial [Lactarius hengduanensis]
MHKDATTLSDFRLSLLMWLATSHPLRPSRCRHLPGAAVVDLLYVWCRLPPYCITHAQCARRGWVPQPAGRGGPRGREQAIRFALNEIDLVLRENAHAWPKRLCPLTLTLRSRRRWSHYISWNVDLSLRTFINLRCSRVMSLDMIYLLPETPVC